MNNEMHEKLLAAQKSMQNPQLDSTANTGKFVYKYASLESILSVVKPALLEQGIVLSQGIREVHAPELEFISRSLETRLFFADSGESLLLDSREIPSNLDAQQFGSYETYMRRYALLSAFALVGAEDDDGRATITPEKAKAAESTAKEAGQQLADAIAAYAVVYEQEPSQVRAKIIEKLDMYGETKKPEALIREAENLHQLIKLAKENEDVAGD